jgi:hypothetical protein
MMNATYSPEDNKLRLYTSQRLDAELYKRVKAHGFIWAPKQGLFVAPGWNPAREDLLLELFGEIGDEDTSLVDRAEVRAERFDTYAVHREAEAERVVKSVNAIADNIPFGQPILVGHHSEKRARRDARRIEDGMHKAVKLWETSAYWLSRADGAIRSAKYREKPEVRQRRIKKIEAEKRSVMRTMKQYETDLEFWKSSPTLEKAVSMAGRSDSVHWHMSYPLDKYPRNPPASQYEGPITLWSALGEGDGPEYAIITVGKATELCIKSDEAYLPRAQRWIDHYNHRLEYENAMQKAVGYTEPPKRKSAKASLPLLNYLVEKVSVQNPYHRGECNVYPMKKLTSDEWAKTYSDSKGTRISADGTHRIRIYFSVRDSYAVFISDCKAHPIPDVKSAPVEVVPEVKEELPEPPPGMLFAEMASPVISIDPYKPMVQLGLFE